MEGKVSLMSNAKSNQTYFYTGIIHLFSLQGFNISLKESIAISSTVLKLMIPRITPLLFIYCLNYHKFSKAVFFLDSLLI